ncbi:MAG: tRNA (adenosine(37)-N6)-threonylcarbamoyltransferase complex ATPase subunit type 1 TsaE [Bacteroides sp.]|nr:tRNA (adenosine(37)-N6)-threonylcarbamoyltransferase complex ATPase subunit type 1 TsaE [Bacteroidales bacterium]MBD5305543.1 tRNA (adenosine(37)-N6)-threonylcarbamoyltransferase complex ATPase subunit type 1 TsaE [Bacteroides sp.]
MNIRIADEADIDRAAAEFLHRLGDHKHVALVGAMGAGKTTLVGALAHALGVEDDVNSPTFSIINEYRDANDEPIYHFDFYRIETPEEAMDLGLDEYFDSGALCLMEWPENVAALLPDDTLTVKLIVDEDGSRTLISED